MSMKKRKYPYPVPEFLACLEARRAETRAGADEGAGEQEYLVLARLLELCHATMEHANEGWHAGHYSGEDALERTYEAIQFGFRRLIPLLLDSVAGGWHELLAYIEQPASYPWYDPLIDWSCAPPLKAYHPDEDNADDSPPAAPTAILQKESSSIP